MQCIIVRQFKICIATICIDYLCCEEGDFSLTYFKPRIVPQEASRKPQTASKNATMTETSSATITLPPPTCAPFLLNANTAEKKLYWDRSHYSSPDAQIRALAHSSTVYVGNLAFSTRSVHLRRCFEMLGPVKAVHLGLHRENKTPCGFAFVEFSPSY